MFCTELTWSLLWIVILQAAFSFPHNYLLPQPWEIQSLSLQHNSLRQGRTATRAPTSLLFLDSGPPRSHPGGTGAKARGIHSLPSSQEDCQTRIKRNPSIPSNLSAFWLLENTCILSNIGYVTPKQKQMKPMNRKQLLLARGEKIVTRCCLFLIIISAYFIIILCLFISIVHAQKEHLLEEGVALIYAKVALL